jgi:hypothetical protein
MNLPVVLPGLRYWRVVQIVCVLQLTGLPFAAIPFVLYGGWIGLFAIGMFCLAIPFLGLLLGTLCWLVILLMRRIAELGARLARRYPYLR